MGGASGGMVALLKSLHEGGYAPRDMLRSLRGEFDDKEDDNPLKEWLRSLWWARGEMGGMPGHLILTWWCGEDETDSVETDFSRIEGGGGGVVETESRDSASTGVVSFDAVDILMTQTNTVSAVPPRLANWCTVNLRDLTVNKYRWVSSWRWNVLSSSSLAHDHQSVPSSSCKDSFAPFSREIWLAVDIFQCSLSTQVRMRENRFKMSISHRQ